MGSEARIEEQHALTLAFRDPILEAAYRRHAAESTLRWYRIGWALLWVGFAASWFADPIMMGTPENAAVTRMLRMAVGVPLLTGVLAFGYAPAAWFGRAWAQVHLFGVGVMLVVPTASLLWMPEPGRVQNGTASISLVSVLLASLVTLPVRFVNALPAALLIVGPVLAIGLHFIVHDDPIAVALWFLVGAATGVFGAWMNEHRHRQAFAATRRLDEERARSERLLRNVLPAPIAERLKDQAGEIADSFDAVTVLFADLAGFTPLSASMSPESVVRLLNRVFTRFDELAAQHGVEKIKTIGDAYMLVAGLPEPRADHAAAAAEIALDLRAALDELGRSTGVSLQIRIGLCSGPAVAGVIGVQKFAYDLWGDTVNTAARMESHGLPGRIHVAESTYRLLAERFELSDRGIVDVKGKGPMHTYFLEGRRGAASGPVTPA